MQTGFIKSQEILKRKLMDKILISIDELNAIIKGAVDTAFTAHSKGDETVLISRRAAAKRLGVDVSTLWRWDKSGYLKVSTRIGKACWYTEACLRMIERGEREV